MNKDELLAKFQRLGKVLMTPVLILPIAGILQGFGNAFTSPTLTAAVPWLAAPGFAIFFSILKAAAGIVMNNIPVIFSICLAYGFAKSEKATAALCGFLGYMCMNSVMGTFLTATGVIDPANLTTGQSTILGITTLDTGVIGGLLVGAIVAWLHNRYYKIELPAVFSIFNGTRFIPAVTLLSCSILALVMSFVFPVYSERSRCAVRVHQDYGCLWCICLRRRRAHAPAFWPASLCLFAVLLHVARWRRDHRRPDRSGRYQYLQCDPGLSQHAV